MCPANQKEQFVDIIIKGLQLSDARNYEAGTEKVVSITGTVPSAVSQRILRVPAAHTT